MAYLYNYYQPQLLYYQENNIRAAIANAEAYQDYHQVIRLIEQNLFADGEDLIKVWDEAHYCIARQEKGKNLTALEKFRIRQKYVPPPSINPTGERKTNTLPRRAKTIMRNWLKSNNSGPYPTRDEVVSLTRHTGLTYAQVKSWFGNMRRRNKQKRKTKAASTSTFGCEEPTVTANVPRTSFYSTAEPTFDLEPPIRYPQNNDQGTDQFPMSTFIGDYNELPVEPFLQNDPEIMVPRVQNVPLPNLVEPRIDIVPSLKFPGRSAIQHMNNVTVLSWDIRLLNGLERTVDWPNDLLDYNMDQGMVCPDEKSSVVGKSTYTAFPASWMISPCPNRSVHKEDLCTQESGDALVNKAAHTLLELANTRSSYDKPCETCP